MMDLSMNFDMEECIVTAMLDQGNRIDTMEAIDRVIPFLAGDSEMIMLVCETIRKLFCIQSSHDWKQQEQIAVGSHFWNSLMKNLFY